MKTNQPHNLPAEILTRWNMKVDHQYYNNVIPKISPEDESLTLICGQTLILLKPITSKSTYVFANGIQYDPKISSNTIKTLEPIFFKPVGTVTPVVIVTIENKPILEIYNEHTNIRIAETINAKIPFGTKCQELCGDDGFQNAFWIDSKEQHPIVFWILPANTNFFSNDVEIDKTQMDMQIRFPEKNLVSIPEGIRITHTGRSFFRTDEEMCVGMSVTYEEKLPVTTSAIGYEFDNLLKNIVAHPHFDNYVYFVATTTDIPPYVTHLTFDDNFNQPIKNLPPSIIYLTFGRNFNQPIQNNIPPSVTHLTFGTWFNRQ